MNFCLQETKTDILFSDIKEFFHNDIKSKDDTQMDANSLQHHIEGSLINIEIMKEKSSW